MDKFDNIVQLWSRSKPQHDILRDIIFNWSKMFDIYKLNISILYICVDGHVINEIEFFPNGNIFLKGEKCKYCGSNWLSIDDMIKICKLMYNTCFNLIPDIGFAGEKGEEHV